MSARSQRRAASSSAARACLPLVQEMTLVEGNSLIEREGHEERRHDPGRNREQPGSETRTEAGGSLVTPGPGRRYGYRNHGGSILIRRRGPTGDRASRRARLDPAHDATIDPFRISMIRSARRAIFGSWVTTTSATPSRR